MGVFFLMESTAVGSHWKTSLNVGALVTLVAAVHYFYMREFWVIIGMSPILYRYIDWSITVPMLTFGYMGETGTINGWAGFILGLSGRGFILFEIFAGEGGQVAGAESMSAAVQSGFNTMRLIVT